MKGRTRAPLAARLVLALCVAASAVPAAAADLGDSPDRARSEPRRGRDEPERAPIIVTGQRPEPIEQAPSTSESVDAAMLSETVNMISPEDSLRYLPSLLVRRRHVGDTQAPLATRTSGVGASARSLIYADGILLSALIGNNNSSASPRWGMVSPEEIERVEILYGPFSAAYPGNSIGAVVNIETRLPERFEASLDSAMQVQRFDQYDVHGFFPASRLSGTVGDRAGKLSWFAGASHVWSRSQPLAYVTAARPAGTGAAGLAVSGALEDRNRAGAPIFVLGAGGFERQRQDVLNLKLAFDAAPSLRLVWRSGLFLNDTDSTVRTWLDGQSGAVYAGSLNMSGRPVNVPASAFSNNVYRLDERQWMHALSAQDEQGAFQWQAVATLYDFADSEQRIPSGALPGAFAGGPGSIARLDGTGWHTLDIKARLKPEGSSHDLGFGAHYDRFVLKSDRFAAADWRNGEAGALIQSARGRTRTFGLWLQDRWTLGADLDLTLGARYEWWRAFDGSNFSLAPALAVDQPGRSARGLSPKASLRWRPAAGWSLTASAGQAYRFPTVTELYQAIGTGPTLTVPDPRLAPERARSVELTAERDWESGRLRLSLFGERINDALISQTALLVPASSALFSFVQNVDEVRTRGLELVFERRGLIVPGLDVSGSITLADSEIVRDRAFPAAEGKDLPQIPRRRATLVLTWRPGDGSTFTLAGRYASRSFGTIDNSDIVGHTFQGFESWLAIDARASFRIGGHWDLAFGVDNIGARKYYLFHPFPQRAFVAELGWRW